MSITAVFLLFEWALYCHVLPNTKQLQCYISTTCFLQATMTPHSIAVLFMQSKARRSKSAIFRPWTKKSLWSRYDKRAGYWLLTVQHSGLRCHTSFTGEANTSCPQWCNAKTCHQTADAQISRQQGQGVYVCACLCVDGAFDPPSNWDDCWKPTGF